MLYIGKQRRLRFGGGGGDDDDARRKRAAGAKSTSRTDSVEMARFCACMWYVYTWVIKISLLKYLTMPTPLEMRTPKLILFKTLW